MDPSILIQHAHLHNKRTVFSPQGILFFQNAKKGSCSEQGPNPKGYANETPQLLFKCLGCITIEGFRHRQVPRESPAQIHRVFLAPAPPGKD